ncbi:4'-phosphopantetheinyl transferase family protein [Dyella telluris]|uniref:4'-phosphopantetheinyl transferase superfamily protein n=1 Tax=Dyella telluris TaxID=2763498 RepID=A0A7G8Q4A9_9GAMM|nr:4'-phosphopantetheinyl transferase superfamily protein [Dyella telluris]QNK01617.1 4'-phosphopantetheinyl transferase superfamily protein [Dyella telluris]
MLQQASFSRFTHRVAAALRACGFVAPTDHEARVVVFDSTPWWPLLDEAADLLSPQEASRAARFRHALDHHTYTIAHAFWRVALGITLDADPAAVQLARSPEGQPLLPGSGLATSLSHSGTMVAIAIARGAAIGVDIEGLPSRVHLQDIASVLCAPDEAAAMALLDGNARTRALLDLWTRKEALLKAFGVGLRVPPASIEADHGRLIEPPAVAAETSACRVFPLAMPVGWLGSLALAVDIERHTLHHV